MPLLILILLLFVWFGWALPNWMWGAVPIVVGILMLAGGILGMIGSMARAGASAGLGSVLIAFFGVVVLIFGLGMAGRSDIADVCLGWLDGMDDKTLLIGGFVIGVILAGLAGRQ